MTWIEGLLWIGVAGGVGLALWGVFSQKSNRLTWVLWDVTIAVIALVALFMDRLSEPARNVVAIVLVLWIGFVVVRNRRMRAQLQQTAR